MSQAHDAQRAYLLFGNAFRFILPKGSHLSPKLLELLNPFEQKLAQSYEELKPKDPEDIFSLCWMMKAMSIILEAHNNLKALMNELQFPVSDWDEDWIDMYMDGSVKILDVCIALCSEISRLDQGQLLLKYVRCILEKSIDSPSSDQLKRARKSLFDWIRKINSKNPKLESCTAIFQTLQGSLHFPRIKNPAKGKVLMRALYGVKVMNVYVFSVLVAALSNGSQTPLDLHIFGKFPWLEAFNKLKSAVDDRVKSPKSKGEVPVVKELKAAQICVSKFHALTDMVDCKEELMPKSDTTDNEMEASSLEKCTDSEATRSLKECIKNLTDGGEMLGCQLDVLSKQVNEFFQIIMSERDALLSNLRASLVPKESKVWHY